MDKTGFTRLAAKLAFPDFISTEKIKRKGRFHDDPVRNSPHRGFLLPLLLGIFCIVLFLRLSFLQIFQGTYFRNLSNSNRIRTTIVHAPRGIIFDRNKTPLVFNKPGFRKKVPSASSGQDKTIQLSQQEALSMISNGEKLDIDSLRLYPQKEKMAHVLGFIGQISVDDLKKKQFSTYLATDVIGKTGIEKQYEQELSGISGRKLVEVDSNGKEIRTLGQTDPIPGVDIILTIDAKLQDVAYTAMAETPKGVVMVSNPHGEILALVSKPSFDPNVFTLGSTYKVATESAYPSISTILSDSQNQPMLNRAISGVYPPGSTFKLITAAAGLEEHIIDKSYRVDDIGILKVGEFSFANWYFTQYGRTDGDVDVVKGIGRSNDIFFYKLAEKVGVDHLSKWASKLGVGKATGIDLEGEADGLLPTEAWKKSVIGESWYLGDTYHYGIGQGYLLTTPLQVNLWTQALANNGVIYQPHLLKRNQQKALSNQRLQEETNRLIREGMIYSCRKEGVAWPLFEFRVKNKELTKKIDNKNFFVASIATSSAQATPSARLDDTVEISIACKTGTAQWGGEKDMPHAWTTLYAPAHNPEIIVTVLAEAKGEGSNEAAPIAKKVLEEWFSR